LAKAYLQIKEVDLIEQDNLTLIKVWVSDSEECDFIFTHDPDSEIHLPELLHYPSRYVVVCEDTGKCEVNYRLERKQTDIVLKAIVLSKDVQKIEGETLLDIQEEYFTDTDYTDSQIEELETELMNFLKEKKLSVVEVTHY